MIGSILWSVLLIQLATGSPVVSRSTNDSEVKTCDSTECCKCERAETHKDVLKEGTALTINEMEENIKRMFPDFDEESNQSDYIKIHRLKKFQLEMMQKEGKSNFLKYFASLIDEMIKNSCTVYPKACKSGKQTSRAITELKIREEAEKINHRLRSSPFKNIGCEVTDSNKWKACKIKKYNLLKEIIDIKDSCSYLDEDCSRYNYD
ncbi:PREDICTED: uncharacterized protein LOC109583924 [Amphimedon queenslandica]|uniref:Uncharacterized protein n=1 Tax=Amphimedon queenslandica TaxID=400682 RepID=A0AAN0JDD5_AMPQE|nr:PREDICTED: uncharacterized protein LOC109583924 [Amphimedon queenslandica]|eukprot:XP_019855009.1 PREDICTED: uncharacterized protein LOC109583924 [Amphimedon queenslandica]